MMSPKIIKDWTENLTEDEKAKVLDLKENSAFEAYQDNNQNKIDSINIELKKLGCPDGALQISVSEYSN